MDLLRKWNYDGQYEVIVSYFYWVTVSAKFLIHYHLTLATCT